MIKDCLVVFLSNKFLSFFNLKVPKLKIIIVPTN